MTLDPRTPVLVGAGVLQQREEDPAAAVEPLELMIAALERAAEDAGSRELLSRADSIRAPRGFWGYLDPCRLIAERIGATDARTEVAEVGVLQTSLLGGAARDIASGRADVVLVTGGEARYRALRAQITGTEAPLTHQEGIAPDRVHRPDADIVSPEELRTGVVMPVAQYAMIDVALRGAEGRSVDDHRRELAELWSGFSRVAAANPDAWSRVAVDADAIREPGGKNRMLAFPYTKLHASQWNVDQAAGLIFCSVATARALGISRARWVFPLGVADSNHMLPFSERRAIHRCAGFALAGRQALARQRLEPADVAHLELYSCFPAAVRVQTRELDIPPDRPLTVTGGMAFAGGPLNNFVLQAQARMADVLRGDPGSIGMVTAVSGMLTKQGVSLWSTEPGAGEFGFDDVSADAAREVEKVAVVRDAIGPATIATYTVLYDDGQPSRAVLVCDLEDGRRALVVTPDPQLAAAMTRDEFCGRPVRLRGEKPIELA